VVTLASFAKIQQADSRYISVHEEEVNHGRFVASSDSLLPVFEIGGITLLPVSSPGTTLEVGLPCLFPLSWSEAYHCILQ